MDYELRIESQAHRLPEAWDLLAGDNPYLKRDFLSFIERTEADYQPRYYMLYAHSGELDSYFIAHRRRGYNLGMFSPVNLPITVTLIYLPMCVTRSGVVLGSLREAVFREIQAIKGFKMVLNLPDGEVDSFAVGLTCPKCILTLRWSSLEDYLGSMRSPYRNHYKRILKKTAGLTIRHLENGTAFDNLLYSLYCYVRDSSRVRIERLSKAYFQGEMFRLFVAEEQGRPVGFVQLLENGTELIFEFVGLDYQCNARLPVYHRLLLEIVDYGIRGGFRAIDFGQTADDTKLKLGCKYTYLYAALHHSNPLINAVCRKFAPFLEYKPLTTRFRVFKEKL